MRVLMIRHGETKKNMDKRNGSRNKDKNSDLNEIGIHQSIKTGKFINNLENCDSEYVVLHSPILRTLNTAKYICDQLDVEINMVPENRVANCTSKDQNILLSNILPLFKELYAKHDNKIVIIVTHNHIIESAYKYAKKLDDNDEYKVRNCSITELDYTNDDLSVLKFNFYEHLID